LAGRLRSPARSAKRAYCGQERRSVRRVMVNLPPTQVKTKTSVMTRLLNSSARGKESLKALWQKSWPEKGVQHFDPVFDLLDRIKFERLEQHLPAPGRAIEVGCGSGRLAAHLTTRGFEAVCLDYTTEALKCARRSWTAMAVEGARRFVLGDAFRLPFPDGSFDLVTSTGLLEHFEDPRPVVREMVRILSPEGVFYADVCPGRNSLVTSMDWYTRWRAPDEWVGFYENRIEGEELRAILEECGVALDVFRPAGVAPPRVIPLGTRLPFLKSILRAITAPTRLWSALDRPRLAQLMGLYWFVVGRKAS
jgi:SAM-dependent methyltransferase